MSVHIESVGKQAHDQSGKYRVNENGEENYSGGSIFSAPQMSFLQLHRVLQLNSREFKSGWNMKAGNKKNGREIPAISVSKWDVR